MNVNWHEFAISMFVLITSLTVHEFAHAKCAELCGDDTARLKGRCSLNPLDHLDPIGTIFMVITSITGFGIGWAKPVPVNPLRFRHPRWDDLKVSLWGPLSNLLIAAFFGVVIRVFGAHLQDTDRTIVFFYVIINLSLAMFNLLPIPPLDGSHIVSALLPADKAYQWQIFISRYGFMMLFAVIFLTQYAGFDLIGLLIGKPVDAMFAILTGVHI